MKIKLTILLTLLALFAKAGVVSITFSNWTPIGNPIPLANLSGDGTGLTFNASTNNAAFNSTTTSATNIVTFSSVSLVTNTLGYDGTASVSAGTTVVIKTPSGVTVDTVGTVGSVHEVIPLRNGWYLSGTTMSGVIY